MPAAASAGNLVAAGVQALLAAHAGLDGERVAVIDWHKRELPVGPPPDHKLAREQVMDEMRSAGWSVAQELDVLPYQYVLVFRWPDSR